MVRKSTGWWRGRAAEGLLGLVLAAVAIGVAGRAGAADEPLLPAGSAGAGPVISLEPAPPLASPTTHSEPTIAPLGVAFDSDEAMAQHAEEVHVTTLRARLDPSAHKVAGEGQIVWRNTSQEPATELYLHLYLNAFKNQRTVFLRSRLGDGRGAVAPSDWGYIDVKSLVLRGEGEQTFDLWANAERTTPGDPEDQTDIRVPLPSPCPPGGELRLEVSFESKLPTITERTGYQGSFHLVAQWFPKIARRTKAGEWRHFAFHRLSEFDADFGTYDVTLDVPSGFVVGATGERVEESEEAGRVRARYVQHDVHDFAWTAWDQFHEQTIEHEGVSIRLLSPHSYEPADSRELWAAKLALDCYGRRYGRYPYKTLTIVHPPAGAEEAGGMEYPTFITTGGPWYGPPLVRFVETLTVHEFGHQIFYGLVASDENLSPFLDEGLNSYAEGACLGEALGAGSGMSAAGLEVQTEAVHRESALASGHDDMIGRAAPDFGSARHYSALVYSRTATLLRSLGGAFGREVVDKALGRFTRAYRFGHPEPRHLLAAFEEVGGPALSEALRVGVFERGWVDFAVTELSSSKRAQASGVFDGPRGRETIQGSLEEGRYDGWALIVRRGSLKLPVDIELTFDDGSKKRVRWDGQAPWVRVVTSGEVELRSAVVDPDGLIELDERFSNNAMSRATKKVAPRVLERLWYAMGLATYWVAP